MLLDQMITYPLSCIYAKVKNKIRLSIFYLNIKIRMYSDLSRG